MRRTASMVSGWACVEWLDRTIVSDATPGMWALVYCTTPSSPSSMGPVPSTAIIECAATPGATGIVDNSTIKGLSGLIPNPEPNPLAKENLLVSSFNASFSLVARSAIAVTIVPGRCT